MFSADTIFSFHHPFHKEPICSKPIRNPREKDCVHSLLALNPTGQNGLWGKSLPDSSKQVAIHCEDQAVPMVGPHWGWIEIDTVGEPFSSETSSLGGESLFFQANCNQWILRSFYRQSAWGKWYCRKASFGWNWDQSGNISEFSK